MGGPDPGRHDRVSFNKRARTVLSKAHDLATLCRANVYVLINHPRGLVVYNSEDESWPPFDDTMLHDVQRFSRSTMEHARKSASQRELMQLYHYLHCRAQLLQSVNQQPEDTGADIRSGQVSASNRNEDVSELEDCTEQDIDDTTMNERALECV